MSLFRGSLCVLFVCGFSAAIADDDDPLKAYPPAAAGMKRHVLRLPKEAHEDSFRVEFIVGRTEITDSVNTHGFSGKIEEETVEGWGYPKYTVKKLGEMFSTLIGSSPDAPKIKKFVSVQPVLVRYNSRLPVVVYTPADAEVRFRIWRADGVFKPIP